MKRSKRPQRTVWQATRRRIWQRDQQRCQGPHCQDQAPGSLSLEVAHIDHIQELSKGGTNADDNLRTLCRRCHCLRTNISHQGMIAQALRDGVIPINWRQYVWEG